jgi:hypothetical protein
MKHQVTPLFSVPLYKTVLDPLDPMEESWIKNLKFPPQDADKERWSLAFNFFVKGKVGVGTTQLQL